MNILWVKVEGTDICHKFKHENEKRDLYELGEELISTLKLGKIGPDSLKYYTHDWQEIGADTAVESLKSSYSKPIIIRYPISADSIDVKLKLDDKTTESRYKHSSGLWSFVCETAEEEYSFLRSAKYGFLWTDEGRHLKLWSEIQFLDVVSKIKPNSNDVRKIDLTIIHKDKKSYSKWKLKEALRVTLNKTSLKDLDSLELNEEVKICDDVLISFLSELERKLFAFKEPDRNEHTCREFISPYLTSAVKFLSKELKVVLELYAEEEVTGSKAYGPVDYVIYWKKFIILVTEAKANDMDQGTAQNLLQMLSAMEQLAKEVNDDSGLTVCGAVTTGKKWRFFQWNGGLNNPVVKKSEIYECNSGPDFHVNAKIILQFLVSLIKKQIQNTKRKLEVDTEDSSAENSNKKHKSNDEIQNI